MHKLTSDPKTNLLMLAEKLDRLDADHAIRIAGTQFRWDFKLFLRTVDEVRQCGLITDRDLPEDACGSVGCALGYANLLFRGKKTFESVFSSEDSMFWKRAFDLSDEDYNNLFVGDIRVFMRTHDAPIDGPVMPSDVAKAIRFHVAEAY